MTTRGLVVVGGGMAAVRLLERLTALGGSGPVTVVSDEPELAYNRVLLPALVAGRTPADTLNLHPLNWYQERGIKLHLGCRAERLDMAGRRLHLANGESLSFDRLVLATGSRVPLPDIPGMDLNGVLTLRSLADARRLCSVTPPGAPVVVVGGGLLGLEAAASLSDRGHHVCVVHKHPGLLNRQLDSTAAGLLLDLLTQRGLSLRLGAVPKALTGAGQVSGVVLESGEVLPAASVLFATGTRPNDTLASQAGLVCDHGVVVDRSLRSSHPGVFAVGECARIGGHSYGLVEPVYRQADVLARALCGESAAFEPPTPAARLKVPGIELFASGQVSDDHRDTVCISDPARGLYRRLFFNRDTLVGAVLLGDVHGGQRLLELIDSATQVPDAGWRTQLAFGMETAGIAA